MAFSLNTLPMELKDRDYTGPIQGVLQGLAASAQGQKMQREERMGLEKLALEREKFDFLKNKGRAQKSPEQMAFEEDKRRLEPFRQGIHLVNKQNYPSFVRAIDEAGLPGSQLMEKPEVIASWSDDQVGEYLATKVRPYMDQYLGMPWEDAEKAKYAAERALQSQKDEENLRRKRLDLATPKESKVLEAVNIDTGKQLSAQTGDLIKGMQGVRSAEQAEKILASDEGIISGKGAGIITNVGNFFSQRGGKLGEIVMGALGLTRAQIANTEAFKAAAGDRVLAAIKPLGTGTAVSNTDREFVQSLVGGDISLTPDAIKQLLYIYKKARLSQAVEHNQRVERWAQDSQIKFIPDSMLVPLSPEDKDLFENERAITIQQESEAPSENYQTGKKARLTVEASAEDIADYLKDYDPAKAAKLFEKKVPAKQKKPNLSAEQVRAIKARIEAASPAEKDGMIQEAKSLGVTF